MKIYLAIPYTGKEEASFKIANQVAGDLMNQGHIVFSPISHTHPIAKSCDLPKDWEFWKKQDESFIRWADEIHVIMFGDIKKSVGVQAEIDLAVKHGKPVVLREGML
jgi:hypothetical protein